MKDIAVIPARKGSKGFPKKNRLFFPLTADFIHRSKLFDRTVVTTDDDKLLDMAETNGFEGYKRPDHISRDTSSIREVFMDLVAQQKFHPHDRLWLFYIPIVFKDIQDFGQAKKIMETKRPPSVSTFIPAKSHPFNCWIRMQNDKVSKAMDNDFFNRQDYPEAFENHHYVFCIQVNAVEHGNNNLLNDQTYPIFLSSEKASRLVEIDEPEDLLRWKQKDEEAFKLWCQSVRNDPDLPEFVRPLIPNDD
jgi:CMP-N-acetylneuraminic acid synthetase